MKKIQTVVLLFCLFFVLMFSFSMAETVEASTQMPEFALKSVRDGKIVNSSIFAGKVLYITFFATWCPPCAQEVPVLVELQDQLAGSGFSIIGLSVDEGGLENVARFVGKKGINYPVLMTEFKTTTDFGGIFGIPVGFLVNKKGHVVKRYTGYVQHSVLEKDIRSLLN